VPLSLRKIKAVFEKGGDNLAPKPREASYRGNQEGGGKHEMRRHDMMSRQQSVNCQERVKVGKPWSF